MMYENYEGNRLYKVKVVGRSYKMKPFFSFQNIFPLINNLAIYLNTGGL